MDVYQVNTVYFVITHVVTHARRKHVIKVVVSACSAALLVGLASYATHHVVELVLIYLVNRLLEFVTEAALKGIMVKTARGTVVKHA
jgi:hypothetical protein